MDSEFLPCRDASCIVVTFQIINYFKTCLNCSISEQSLNLNNFLKAKEHNTQYLISTSHNILNVENHHYHPLNLIKSLRLPDVYVSSNPSDINVKYSIFIRAINSFDNENFNILNDSFRNNNLVGILVQNHLGFYEFLHRKGQNWVLNSYTQNGIIEESRIRGFSGCILKSLETSLRALIYHQS